jgi:hypothetical protein
VKPGASSSRSTAKVGDVAGTITGAKLKHHRSLSSSGASQASIGSNQTGFSRSKVRHPEDFLEEIVGWRFGWIIGHLELDSEESK